jgi:hypothetical protein
MSQAVAENQHYTHEECGIIQREAGEWKRWSFTEARLQSGLRKCDLGTEPNRIAAWTATMGTASIDLADQVVTVRNSPLGPC